MRPNEQRTLLTRASAGISLRSLAVIAAVSFFFVLKSPRASASQTCEIVFSQAHSSAIVTAPQMSGRARSALRSLYALIPVTGRNRTFDTQAFDRELRFYKTPGANRAPQSPEATLALFEASAEIEGRSLSNFSNWVKTAQPRDVQRLLRPFARMKTEDGVRPSVVEDLFVRLYLIGRTDPNSWQSVINSPMPETVRNLIIRRVELELGRKSTLAAFESLGLLRTPGLRDRLSSSMRASPNIVETLSVGSVNVATWLMTGFVFQVPSYSILNSRGLPPHVLNTIRERGFNAALPELERMFGTSARADVALQWMQKVVMIGLMAYAISSVWDDLMHSLLPPGTVPREETNSLQLTLGVMNFWSRLAMFHLGIRAEDSPDTESIRALTRELDLIADDE